MNLLIVLAPEFSAGSSATKNVARIKRSHTYWLDVKSNVIG